MESPLKKVLHLEGLTRCVMANMTYRIEMHVVKCVKLGIPEMSSKAGNEHKLDSVSNYLKIRVRCTKSCILWNRPCILNRSVEIDPVY